MTSVFKPHVYQEYTIQKILDCPQVGLFLEMGLGKTSVTLTALDTLLFDMFEVSKVLIIGPKRVIQDTWVREARKWEHTQHLVTKMVVLSGGAKQREKLLNGDGVIFLIGRENVAWLINHFGKKWPFDMVIVDELSSFKSSKAQRFRALRKVRPLIKRIVGLTGTPAPNGLLDLWAQVYLLDQGERLGKTITGYKDRYFKPDKRNQTTIFSWALKDGAEEAIHKKLSDMCVSMRASDWLDLPERIESIIKVKLSPKDRERYEQLERDLVLPLTESDVVADTAAVLANKLLQMANGAVYDENGKAQTIHNAKLEALDDVIEAANGKPVLVFYNYKHDLDRLKEHLQRHKPRELRTAADIEAWNTGKVQIMLVHPASAGHGLNLQAGGHIIVWFGLTWNLEFYQQANARLDRQGQEHGVIVHHLVAEGTVDENVMAALSGKAKSQEALMQAVRARIERYGGGRSG